MVRTTATEMARAAAGIALLAAALGGAGACARRVAICGDGQLDPASGEECDDGNGTSGDGCSAGCQVEGTMCGDAVCDMAGGETCAGCPADCSTDPACNGMDCGDGVCDLAGGETCAGCAADCAADPACAAVCGDGMVNGTELCDGTDLGGMDCTDVGFTGGTLGCNATCNGWITDMCTLTGQVCGNDLREGTELCDGTDLAGLTCMDAGYTGGTLGCNATCNGLVTSGCTGAGPVCGDGVVAGTEGCDDGDTMAGDGCDGSCAVEGGWTCMGMPSVCTMMMMGGTMPSAAGDLVITEIMRDSATPIADADGEWFEVHNPTGTTFDLGGLEVRDDGTDSFIITGPLAIAPGGYLVLARSTTTGTNGGLTASYAYGTAFTLSNTDDEVEIRNGTTVIDRVAYLDTMFPDTAGFAASLSGTVATTTAVANDVLTNWCDAVALYGTSGTNYGSPGVANPACM